MLGVIKRVLRRWLPWNEGANSRKSSGTESTVLKDEKKAAKSSVWVSDIPDEVIQQWLGIQRDLKLRIVDHDTEPWASAMDDLDLVGGLDVSYTKEDESRACACLVVHSIKEGKIVYSKCNLVSIETKYRTGFLAFKEIVPMMNLWRTLKEEAPEYLPSVVIIDGNGIMHERGIGLASHFGVLADCPTIGVAKSPPFGNFTYQREDVMLERESTVYDGDKVVGAAVIGNGKGRRPIYVSVGNRVSLKTAVAVVRLCCIYRLPEPTRYADIYSREALRQHNLTPLNGLSNGATEEVATCSSPELKN